MKNTRVILSENLTAIMRCKRISSDAALAKLTQRKVDQKTIWRIRNMEQSPTADKLEIIATALGYHAWQLLIPNFDPENPPTATVTKTEADLYQRLQAAAKELTKSQQ